MNLRRFLTERKRCAPNASDDAKVTACEASTSVISGFVDSTVESVDVQANQNKII